MRQSEILNIHPEHIDGYTLKIPVAKARPRTIPLTKTALDILKSYTLPFNYFIIGYDIVYFMSPTTFLDQCVSIEH